jgi:hypothetical protein
MKDLVLDRYEALRERFGAAGMVIGVIALIVALGGSAYALTGADKKLIKKEAKKWSKKFAKPGPAGPQGLPGANGLPGATGNDGAPGANGQDGAPGQDGADGDSVTANLEAPGGPNCTNGGVAFEIAGQEAGAACNGAQGAPGAPGDDSPFAGGTLASGATLKGSWSLGANPNDGLAGLGGAVFTSISFGIPLSSAPTPHYSSEANFGDTCTGSAESPTAPSGHLCVYEGPAFVSNYAFLTFVGTAGLFTADITGAALGFEITDAEPMLVYGTWAVTG